MTERRSALIALRSDRRLSKRVSVHGSSLSLISEMLRRPATRVS